MDKIVILEKDLVSPSCPYCGEDIDVGELKHCTVCDLPHHHECWKENEGCTGYGCSEAPVENDFHGRTYQPDETQATSGVSRVTTSFGGLGRLPFNLSVGIYLIIWVPLGQDTSSLLPVLPLTILLMFRFRNIGKSPLEPFVLVVLWFCFREGMDSLHAISWVCVIGIPIYLGIVGCCSEEGSADKQG